VRPTSFHLLLTLASRLIFCYSVSWLRPNLASKEWVYRQYDHMVRTNTVQLPGADAAVIRVKGTDKAIAFSWTAMGRYCRQDRSVERRSL